jgi:tetratricopeptide (TPR) repeat protein
VEGVRNEDWKYLKAPEEELYHLPSDPYEQKNLAQTESLRLEAMRRRYEDLKQNLSNRSATLAQVALDAEHLEKMLSLGYFWGPQGSTKTAEEKKDPKGMIEVYKLIEWARILLRSPLNSERLMWVVAALEAVLMEDPENQWALFQLGRQLIRLGHFEEARRKFEAILRATPEKQEVYLELAHLELLRKDDMKAEQEIQFFLQQKQERFSQTTKEANFKEKLQHEQELAKAYLLLGEVFSRQKQNKQAQQAFQQFLRYWSGNTPLKKAVETKLQELSRHSSQE